MSVELDLEPLPPRLARQRGYPEGLHIRGWCCWLPDDDVTRREPGLAAVDGIPAAYRQFPVR